MDEARGVHCRDGLGGLANEVHAIALQHRVAGDDQGVEVGAVDELQGNVLAAVGRGAMFQRFDQAGMFQQHSHSPSVGFFSPRKRSSKAAVFSRSRIFRPTIRPVRRSLAL